MQTYNVAEAQIGKGICDRNIAPLKQHIQRYVTVKEKHDDFTAEDIKEALESHDRVKDCRVAVAEVEKEISDESEQRRTRTSFLNNFQFEEEGIRSWREYRIGEGEASNIQSVQYLGARTADETESN